MLKSASAPEPSKVGHVCGGSASNLLVSVMLSEQQVEILSSMENHYEVFRQLINQASEHVGKGRNEAAAIYSQFAADYAWHNHPGAFVSAELEALLVNLGRRTLGEGLTAKTAAGSSPRPVNSVLHVVTTAYQGGGHTRLLWRWMCQDDTRVHNVVLTGQGIYPIPPSLVEAASAAGGTVKDLDKTYGSPVSRARVVRGLAQSADLIVLHTHPHDVVPLIALGERMTSAPIVLMNHSEHVFWLGASISDVVAHIREGSVATSQQRRGIPPERCVILPVPLVTPKRTLSRAEAKRKLGIDESTVVLLTVAGGYKYQNQKGTNFVNALIPVLQKHQNALLMAVGPTHDGDWAAGSQATQGRIKAVGHQPELSVFYEAADIYLDSFPLGSLTSLLEAGCHEVPLLRYNLYPAGVQLLQPDDPAFKGLMPVATDLKDYQEHISRLINDPVARGELGARIRESIVKTHTGEGWKETLENLYTCAAELGPNRLPLAVPEERAGTVEDVALSWMHARTGFSTDLETMSEWYCRLLPLGARLKVWLRVCRDRRTIMFGAFIPESVRFQMRKLFRGKSYARHKRKPV